MRLYGLVLLIVRKTIVYCAHTRTCGCTIDCTQHNIAPAAYAVWLKIERAQRSATLSAGPAPSKLQAIGSHIGYLSPFESEFCLCVCLSACVVN